MYNYFNIKNCRYAIIIRFPNLFYIQNSPSKLSCRNHNSTIFISNYVMLNIFYTNGGFQNDADKE